MPQKTKSYRPPHKPYRHISYYRMSRHTCQVARSNSHEIVYNSRLFCLKNLFVLTNLRLSHKTFATTAQDCENENIIFRNDIKSQFHHCILKPSLLSLISPDTQLSMTTTNPQNHKSHTEIECAPSKRRCLGLKVVSTPLYLNLVKDTYGRSRPRAIQMTAFLYITLNYYTLSLRCNIVGDFRGPSDFGSYGLQESTF